MSTHTIGSLYLLFLDISENKYYDRFMQLSRDFTRFLLAYRTTIYTYMNSVSTQNNLSGFGRDVVYENTQF